MKKVFIKTYGCQMNERDSEAVVALLEPRGYVVTDSETDADVILLNTCSVRDLAEQKALGKMGLLACRKHDKPQLVLGYMGCMAQSRGAELARKQPAVDLVVGTQRFHHIPDYLDRIFARRNGGDASGNGVPSGSRRSIVDVAEEPGSESHVRDHVLGTHENRPVTAFVSIQQGCDMHCTFCIVPQTRGIERSRPIPEIVDEIRQLVSHGVKEVTLLGQIVTSYGRKTMRPSAGRSPFVQLLEAVQAVDGLERIRFSSPHPKGFGDDLVAAYRDLPKLCEHAHLPVQSGSNPMLKRMKRGYTREWYGRIIEKLKASRPGLALSTDVIVGFPGETEADLRQTADLLRDVRFDQAYVFKYSRRRDTLAAGLTEQVGEEVKKERHQILLDIVNEGALHHNRKLVGATVEVLVEGRSEKGGQRMLGRTRTNKIVVFDGSDRHRGELLPVRVDRATVTTLYGDPAIHGLTEGQERS